MHLTKSITKFSPKIIISTCTQQPNPMIYTIRVRVNILVGERPYYNYELIREKGKSMILAAISSYASKLSAVWSIAKFLVSQPYRF